MNFREHWDRWIWLIPAGFILVGAARIFFGREPFCAADEHCLREWMSAMGGWAAVAAGVPSILYLAKQVRHADEAARQAADRQVRRRTGIEAAAKRTALKLARMADFYVEAIADPYIKDDKARAADFIDHFKTLDDILGQKALDVFEDEIAALPVTDIAHARHSLHTHREYLRRYLDGEYPLEAKDIDETFKDGCSICGEYGKALIAFIDQET